MSVSACGGTGGADVPQARVCVPGGFLRCEGTRAVSCTVTGDASESVECGAIGCSFAARGCGAASDAGSGTADAALTCEPDALLCVSDSVARCDGAGIPRVEEVCAAGCANTPTAHCQHAILSNLPADACVTDPGGSYVVDAPTTFDTNGGCDSVIAQGAGLPELCLIARTTIDIRAGQTLRVVGARGLVLLGFASVDVDGMIDAAARGSVAGPGASLTTGAGGDATFSAFFGAAGGAGGGGNATAGAAGGAGDLTGTAGAMHATSGLVPLVGGGLGGVSWRASAPRPAHAGGGGAVHLASCSVVRVGATATISVGGGGGAGGLDGGGGGQGGGAGGAILIEAPGVELEREVLIGANGGGGGQGGTGMVAGLGGIDALLGDTPAAGGGEIAGATQRGGRGGARTDLPTSGSGATSGRGAGGGGGAVGRLRVNLLVGRRIDFGGVRYSASATTGNIEAR